jgi:hypothetical protein
VETTAMPLELLPLNTPHMYRALKYVDLALSE